MLICLLSICASETNSLRDSRCFLLFCQAPTSSRRCCCSIHAYIHTYIHTFIHSFIHSFIHTYIHTYMHTYEPQGAQKDFAKFAVAVQRVQTITLVSGPSQRKYGEHTIALIVCREKDSRAWWKSKKTTQLTHKLLTRKQLALHTCMHACMHTYIHTYIHTQTYIHTYIQHNMSIHNLLTVTLPHTTCSTPILHHLFSLSCFPHAIFTFLLLLVGRS